LVTYFFGDLFLGTYFFGDIVAYNFLLTVKTSTTEHLSVDYEILRG
jgi:hypothetical protein